MPKDRFTVGAVGVGPMGTVLAGCLAEAGARIVAADLPERVAQVRERGLQVIRADRRYVYEVQSVNRIPELADHEPDCIVIATKACILDKIMPQVAEAADKNCLVISAQNGIGNEGVIARYVSSKNVARMIINYAAGVDEEGVAHVAWFNPPNFFGHLTDRDDPRLQRLVDMLNSVDVPTDLVGPVTIRKKAYYKTLLNAALMPMCAVMGLTMRQALAGRATRKLAEDVVKECLAVAERLGYDYGEDAFERSMGYLEKGGDHHPSMSVDLRAKRRTEIDFLNAKILEIGQAFDEISLETNRVLVSLLMTEEVRNGTRRPEDIPDFVLGKGKKGAEGCSMKMDEVDAGIEASRSLQTPTVDH
jgi:2-dehydropantoate 2-reductase